MRFLNRRQRVWRIVFLFSIADVLRSKPCIIVVQIITLSALDGFFVAWSGWIDISWTCSLGGSPHSRGFDWSSVSLKRVRERQKVSTTREQTDMRSEVSSRAQVQKQTAGEGASHGENFGQTDCESASIGCTRNVLRHSTVTIKQTHISEDRHDN